MYCTLHINTRKKVKVRKIFVSVKEVKFIFLPHESFVRTFSSPTLENSNKRRWREAARLIVAAAWRKQREGICHCCYERCHERRRGSNETDNRLHQQRGRLFLFPHCSEGRPLWEGHSLVEHDFSLSRLRDDNKRGQSDATHIVTHSRGWKTAFACCFFAFLALFSLFAGMFLLINGS